MADIIQGDTFKTEEVNLEEFPNDIRQNPTETVVTFGDMHGNTMKLIWCLLKEGIIELTEKDFNTMWEIYVNLASISPCYVDEIEQQIKKFSSLVEKIKIKMWKIYANLASIFPCYVDKREQQIKKFSVLVEKIKIKENAGVRLLGDIFADRGNNDLLTLAVVEKLQTGDKDGNKCNLELILSNHDAWLLALICNDNFNFGDEHKLDPIQDTVLFLTGIFEQGKSLFDIIDDKTNVTKFSQALKDKVQKFVLPIVKSISYAIDGNEIDLFMHAPNNVDVILGLAKTLNFTGKIGTSAKDLAKVIDYINTTLTEIQNRYPKLYAYILLNYIDDDQLKLSNGKDYAIKSTQGQDMVLSTDKIKLLGQLICKLTWNSFTTPEQEQNDSRGNGCINYAEFKKRFPCIRYINHGHTDVHDSHDPHQHNHDNELGKYENTGSHICSYTKEKIISLKD